MSADNWWDAVLRLYPSVPINSRAAVERTTLPTGGGPDGTAPIMVRKGEAVGYSVYVMHRLKDLYGSDANMFRPERWDPNEENEVSLKNIGWGYLPFNGGPRVCLGRKQSTFSSAICLLNHIIEEFAILEASYTIVRLLQAFETFEYDPECEMVEVGEERQDVTLVLAPTDGCHIRVRS
jgi:cytochrome P450